MNDTEDPRPSNGLAANRMPVIMAWTPLLLTASVVPEWKCEATTQTSRSGHAIITGIVTMSPA